MKRTRRIEVIRYSRRFTETQHELAAVDKTAEQQPGDLILDVLAGIPPTSEQRNFDASAPGDAPTECRSLLRLTDWLRLRGRI